MKLGKISGVDLKSQWKRETLFSDWLAEEENLRKLSDALDVQLIFKQREAGVGKYRFDILAKEEGGRNVVIENQFEESNHDHLGKLLTYAAGCDAGMVVWIVERVNEEHQAAIKWLNEHTDQGVGFFLVQLRLIKIDDSSPAPIFTIVERPNNWEREARAETTSRTERERNRLAFWTGFVSFARSDRMFSSVFNPRKPSTDHWLSYACGSSRFHISLTIKGEKQLGVEIYIPDDKAQYEAFDASRKEIEKLLGYQLDWQPLPNKKASRVYRGYECNWSDEKSWPMCFEWLAKTAVEMKRAFCKYAR